MLRQGPIKFIDLTVRVIRAFAQELSPDRKVNCLECEPGCLPDL